MDKNAGKRVAPERHLTTMRLPVDLMEKLAVVADAEGRSRSNLVEYILRKQIEEMYAKLSERTEPNR